MISAWTRHLHTEQEKELFKNQVLGSKQVLKRLQELINEIDAEQDKIERNTQIYDNPNWAYRQAHLNGFKDCLHKMKVIVNPDEPEITIKY